MQPEIDFTADPPVLTGGFPGGPASFVMRRSSRPVDFWDIHKVKIGKLLDFRKDLWSTNLWVKKQDCKFNQNCFL